MKPKLTLTAQQVRDALDYDPETGILIWRAGRKRAGAVAGTVHRTGYLVISFDNRLFLGHRIAWAHQTGVWPLLCIDHINGVRLDNRFANLRDATYQQNAVNSKARGAVGIKGAYLRSSGNWQAIIGVNGKARALGTFSSKEEASAAYLRAATDLHGDFARSS